MRPLFLKLHRWSGLFLALFLTVAGLTGICLAYHDELEAQLIPGWLKVEPQGRALSSFEIARIAERLEPRATVDLVRLSREPDESALVSLEPRDDAATGKPYQLDFDQVFIDPYSGKVLGQRLWGAARFDAAHLMPLLYHMHYSLLMGGLGEWLFGVVALVWFLNCFIGFYLSLPPQKRNFWKNWKRSWQVRSMQNIWRLSFDLHRAAALWIWAMLLVFSLSALQFMFNDQIFRPVLTALLPYKDAAEEARKQVTPDSRPLMSWESAHAQGKALMAKHTAQQGFSVFEESYLSLDRARSIYTYAVRSSLDIREKGGQTRVYFSGKDGRELQFSYASITSGNAVSSWLSALHMRRVWGAPYQAFVALIGLIVATLSVTGVMVWYKRRPVKRPALRGAAQVEAAR